MVKRIAADADIQDVTAKPAAAPVDDLAGLEALEQQAEKNEAAGDQAAQQQERKQEKQEVDTLQADLVSALNMAAAPARPAMWWLTDEQFSQLWGPHVRTAIAENGAEIMRRHGLTMGGLMTTYGPYIGLIAALGPSVAATVTIYKQKKQEQIAPGAAGGTDGGSAQAG